MRSYILYIVATVLGILSPNVGVAIVIGGCDWEYAPPSLNDYPYTCTVTCHGCYYEGPFTPSIHRSCQFTPEAFEQIGQEVCAFECEGERPDAIEVWCRRTFHPSRRGGDETTILGNSESLIMR